MKYIIVLFLYICIQISLFSQEFTDKDVIAVNYASTIHSHELREIVYFLAGDSCAGRETGQIGQKIAAHFIARYFKQIGLPPVLNGTYFQIFPIETHLKTNLLIKNKTMAGDKSEIYYLNGLKSGNFKISESIFAGYGIQTLTNYRITQASDKAFFVLYGEPMKNSNSSDVSVNSESNLLTDFKTEILLAEKKGASVVFFILPDFNFKATVADIVDISSEYELENNFNPYHIPYLFITESFARKLLNFTGNFFKKTSHFTANVEFFLDINTTQDTLYGENVLGFIEGTDLKHEIVVITAHYDHLGIQHGKTYYGADDNASGTAAILEIAEAFSNAQKNGNATRRSVLIMPVSGEEKGLLGSAYYVNNPVFPLVNTIANLNIDMIGRIDAKHSGNSNYVYLIGSDRLSTDLHTISENTNATYTKLELDYTFNNPNDPNKFYYRSDHYNFAKNYIPAIFYFNGVHEDYHKPTDTPDKLDYDKIEKISQLIFYTAWNLANREDRPIVDRKDENDNNR